MLKKIMISYLSPKSWEKNGSFYEKVRIMYFFKITPFEIRRAITGKNYTTIKKRSDITRYFKETILGEMTHLFSFIFLLSISFYFWFTNGYWIAWILTFINIIVNLYPIFLMRYNRIRIAKALGKKVEQVLNSAY